MGTHPSENSIELYLLKPEKLAADERLQLQSHLDSCLRCGEIAALLRSFHAELMALGGEHRRIEEFIDRLQHRPVVIELYPYRYSPDPAVFGQNVLTVLAAKSESGTDYRYSSVCTLVSRDEQTLVRILKDHETDNYRMFLITKRGQRTPGATIRFPALEFSVSIDPESLQAVFSLPPTRTAVDWSNLVAELHLV